MKRRDFTPCLRCGKGVMHAGAPVFYRVRIEQFVIDPAAVNRTAGLEMMLGGNVAIAMAMGPDEDLAKRLSETTGLLCLDCAMDVPFAVLVEAGRDDG